MKGYEENLELRIRNYESAKKKRTGLELGIIDFNEVPTKNLRGKIIHRVLYTLSCTLSKKIIVTNPLKDNAKYDICNIN